MLTYRVKYTSWKNDGCFRYSISLFFKVTTISRLIDFFYWQSIKNESRHFLFFPFCSEWNYLKWTKRMIPTYCCFEVCSSLFYIYDNKMKNRKCFQENLCAVRLDWHNFSLLYRTKQWNSKECTKHTILSISVLSSSTKIHHAKSKLNRQFCVQK